MDKIFPEEVVPLAICMLDFAEMFPENLKYGFLSGSGDLKSLMRSILKEQEMGNCSEEQVAQHCDLIRRTLKNCKLFFQEKISFLQKEIRASKGLPEERKMQLIEFISKRSF